MKIQIRKKKHNTVTSRELYNYYVENQEPGEFTLSYDKWKMVIFDLMDRLSRLMITENLVIYAPYSIGRFGVEKVKGKSRRKVDFHKTKLLGKTVYHDNLHSDCYFFRISWRRKFNQKQIIKNAAYYWFTAVLDAERRKIGKRGLAKWVKQCANDPYVKDYDAPFKI